jgi:hypothetical protein
VDESNYRYQGRIVDCSAPWCNWATVSKIPNFGGGIMEKFDKKGVKFHVPMLIWYT